MHKAALNGHLNILKWLKKNSGEHFNLNLKDAKGCTALYYSCQCDYSETDVGKRKRIVEYLLEMQADPNHGFLVDDDKNEYLMPLHWAVFHGDSDTTNVFLCLHLEEKLGKKLAFHP